MKSKLVEYLFRRIKKRLNEQNTFSGKNRIHPTSYISGSYIIGNVTVEEHVKIYMSRIEGLVEIGRYTSIWGPSTDIISQINGIIIGSFCSIARNVSFQESNHHHRLMSSYMVQKNIFNNQDRNDLISKGPIVVGNDVWIGAHAVILSNVKIGHGAIVGANAVVTKDVPAYAIVAGVPAQIIGYRFPSDIITKLLTINWWDWNIEKIKKNDELFSQQLTMSMLNKIV